MGKATRTMPQGIAAAPFDWTPICVVCVCLELLTKAEHISVTSTDLFSNQVIIPRLFPSIRRVGEVVHMYTMTSLFPYVGFMSAEFQGESSNAAGFVAGYIASSFTFGRFITSFFWGWMADRFGRKPVLATSMLSIAVLSILFGVSKAVAWALATRLILGLLNGTMSTVWALAPELAGNDRIVQVNSFIAGCRGLGMLFGPALGGLLAQPARQFPSTFSSTGLFARYPYLLPNLVGACLACICIPGVIFLVPETKALKAGHCKLVECSGSGSPLYEATAESKPTQTSRFQGTKVDGLNYKSRESGRTARGSPEERSPADSMAEELESGCILAMTSDDGGLDRNGKGEVAESPLLLRRTTEDGTAYGSISTKGTFAAVTDAEEDNDEDVADGDDNGHGEDGLCRLGWLMDIPNIVVILSISSIFAAVIIGFDEAYPLWALSSSDAGGLEWSSMQIGQSLGLAGVGMTVYLFCVYPWLVSKVGILNMVHACGALSPLLFMAVPSISYLSWNKSSKLIVSSVLVTMIGCSTSAMSQGLTMASTNPVPPHLRGKLSGLYLMSHSLGRTIGPACWATMFAWSVSPEGGQTISFVDFRFVFAVSALLIAVVALVATKIFTVESMTTVAVGWKTSTSASTSAKTTRGGVN